MSDKAPTSTLAVVALVFCFIFPPLGFLLAVAAFIRIKGSKGMLGGQTLAIIALCCGAFFSISTVGCMAAIAIPNFVKFQCRSKQSEAKGNLKGLYVAQESLRAEKDRYSTSFKELEWEPRGQTIRYDYVIIDASNDAFTAEARGKGEMTGDLWRINNENRLDEVASKCR